MLGSALTLASFVKVLHAVFLCKPSPQIRKTVIQKAAWPARAPMLLLASLCVVFGIFANSIPLRHFIEPAVGQPLEFTGTWLAPRATGFMLIVLAGGWMVYALTLRNGRLRKVPTYIGGERLDQTRISGVPRGAARHVEVTGVDFYRTVEALPVLRPLYGMSKRKLFDLYDLLGTAAGSLSSLLRAAHKGLLPMYLSWFVLGLLGILYVIMEGKR
jgi:NADH:ubiquinone oxidoreductase subunit 5 (subunit L)/multisubunit Na+/H+ antiporter MnhA subunit